jgi:sec-independent protein translocase protein TatA
MTIGVPELLIVLAIVLVLVGGKKLPGLGRGLGTGMREFKDSIKGRDRDVEPNGLPSPHPSSPEETVTGEVVREPRR